MDKHVSTWLPAIYFGEQYFPDKSHPRTYDRLFHGISGSGKIQFQKVAFIYKLKCIPTQPTGFASSTILISWNH